MRNILSNQRGVALMMIITAILFLTVIYGDFTFDSKISRLKATNMMDRTQAKLLAESGLQMAMTRLRLYKEAYNKIQSNANLKQSVPPQLLNQLWEIPYIYPIPTGEGAGRAVKDTVDKFMKESIVDGEIRVTVQNMSGKINLNSLRMDFQKLAAAPQDSERDEDEEYKDNKTDSNNQKDFSIDQALFLTMKRLVDEKKEKDEAFGDRYGNIDYRDLFTNLRYYMSDFGSINRDPLMSEAEQIFQRMPMTPKYGPMTSASELYAIPGWDDQLIELIQNEFSVYPNTQIDFNKITANLLKVIIPNMTDDDIKEFFLYRDDLNNPKFFNTTADFKRYIVEQERLMSDTDFDARISMLEKSGITFGSNPTLFKVISEGIFNRSTYTLVATIMMPTQGSQTNDQKPPARNQKPGEPPVENPPTEPNEQSSQLLEPRIIEIQVN